MYDWNDIVIIGDSWCAERIYDNHWPKILVKKITGKYDLMPRGKGFSGASWWSTRNHLLKELKYNPIKILILCHTEANRIPSDYDYGYNYWSVLENRKNNQRFEAAAQYFEYIHSFEFHKWCQLQWFNEVDNIIKTNGIEKIIHLHCFPDMFYKKSKTNIATHIFKTGMTIQDSLYAYRNNIFDSNLFPNHLSYNQNHKLAMKLYDIIDTYCGDGFCYTKKLLDDITDV